MRQISLPALGLCGLAGALALVSMSHLKGTGSEADSKANFYVPSTVPGVQLSRQIRIKNFLEGGKLNIFMRSFSLPCVPVGDQFWRLNKTP